MAGHSKWANIKRKKEVVDKKKGNAFAKLSKAIIISVIEGNGITNPDFNVRLRLAIEKAKAANMPKENIERAIQKGAGQGKDQLFSAIYEGFGPMGSAFLVKTLTDNKNRTLAEVRLIIEKNGGKIASQGAASYLFSINDEGEYLAYAPVELNGEEGKQVSGIIEKLEEIDDVESVITNVIINE